MGVTGSCIPVYACAVYSKNNSSLLKLERKVELEIRRNGISLFLRRAEEGKICDVQY